MAETTSRRRAGLVISQTPSGVRPRVTPVISPLSGSTNHWPATETAIKRRSVPTPGSTTARWTDPFGKGVDDGRQHEAALEDVLRRDRMADVHELDSRRQVEQHALERRHVGTADAEIGRQSDDPRSHRASRASPPADGLVTTAEPCAVFSSFDAWFTIRSPRRPP